LFLWSWMEEPCGGLGFGPVCHQAVPTRPPQEPGDYAPVRNGQAATAQRSSRPYDLRRVQAAGEASLVAIRPYLDDARRGALHGARYLHRSAVALGGAARRLGSNEPTPPASGPSERPHGYPGLDGEALERPGRPPPRGAPQSMITGAPFSVEGDTAVAPLTSQRGPLAPPPRASADGVAAVGDSGATGGNDSSSGPSGLLAAPAPRRVTGSGIGEMLRFHGGAPAAADAARPGEAPVVRPSLPAGTPHRPSSTTAGRGDAAGWKPRLSDPKSRRLADDIIAPLDAVLAAYLGGAESWAMRELERGARERRPSLEEHHRREIALTSNPKRRRFLANRYPVVDPGLVARERQKHAQPTTPASLPEWAAADDDGPSGVPGLSGDGRDAACDDKASGDHSPEVGRPPGWEPMPANAGTSCEEDGAAATEAASAPTLILGGVSSASGGGGAGAFGSSSSKPSLFGGSTGGGFQLGGSSSGPSPGAAAASPGARPPPVGAASSAGGAAAMDRGLTFTAGGLFSSASASGGAAGGLFGAPSGGLFAGSSSGGAASGSLFSATPVGTASSSSLFSASSSGSAASGGLFGLTSTAGGLFGSASASGSAAGGLFGAPSGGLFGGSSSGGAASGSLFSATPVGTASSSSLFGASSSGSAASGALFGAAAPAAPADSAGAPLFGEPAATGGGGFFGASNKLASLFPGPVMDSSSLFGAAAGGGSGLFSGSGTAGGSGLFGGSGATGGGGLFGGSGSAAPASPPDSGSGSAPTLLARTSAFGGSVAIAEAEGEPASEEGGGGPARQARPRADPEVMAKRRVVRARRTRPAGGERPASPEPARLPTAPLTPAPPASVFPPVAAHQSPPEIPATIPAFAAPVPQAKGPGTEVVDSSPEKPKQTRRARLATEREAEPESTGNPFAGLMTAAGAALATAAGSEEVGGSGVAKASGPVTAEPAPDTGDDAAGDGPIKVGQEDFWRVQVEAIYRRRNAIKLKDVPGLLEKHKGKEVLLYKKVCQRYDLDPTKFYADPKAWEGEDKDIKDDGGDGNDGAEAPPGGGPTTGGLGLGSSLFGGHPAPPSSGGGLFAGGTGASGSKGLFGESTGSKGLFGESTGSGGSLFGTGKVAESGGSAFAGSGGGLFGTGMVAESADTAFAGGSTLLGGTSSGLCGAASSGKPSGASLFGSATGGSASGMFGAPSGGLFAGSSSEGAASGSLFGLTPAATASSSSLFGGPSSSSAASGGLFGAAAPAAPADAGGAPLFGEPAAAGGGAAPAAPADTGSAPLFGEPPATGAGLFGSATGGAAGGLFGAPSGSSFAVSSSGGAASGSLFGVTPAATASSSSLFGGPSSGSAASGGLFGAASGSGLFGGFGSTGGGNLFGGSGGGNLFGGSGSAGGSGLFGARSSPVGGAVAIAEGEPAAEESSKKRRLPDPSLEGQGGGRKRGAAGMLQ